MWLEYTKDDSWIKNEIKKSDEGREKLLEIVAKEKMIKRKIQ